MRGTVRIEQGHLSGSSSTDGAVWSFKGIPYAKPPLGSLRWRPPEPMPFWDGVRPAKEFAASPVQPRRVTSPLSYVPPAMSEDCLTLNVWTAARDPDERRPVMVWFYQGAQVWGAASAPICDGEALARVGVVVVTFAQRLGRIGNFAHPGLSDESEHGVSGNYGLLDQIAMLKWVQRNIAAFGGNPNNVTIFGQSAGSSNVSLLMASPLAKGLFHRGIAQSGGEFINTRPQAGWSSVSALRDTEKDGVRLAEVLGARSVADLRERSPADIMAVWSGEKPVNWRDGFPNPVFICAYPNVDGHVIPEMGVRAVFERGMQNDVPLITGSNAIEGAGKIGARNLKEYNEMAKNTYGPLTERFLKTFPATTDDEAREAWTLGIGDQLFSWQNWTFARLHARTSDYPVYYYRYRHIPPYPPGFEFPEGEGDPRKILGAFHGAEIQYVFRTLEKRDWPWQSEDRQVSNIISSYWMNFAKSGDPNGPGLPQWPRFNDANERTLFFDPVPSVGKAPDTDRLSFWDAHFGLVGQLDPAK